MINNTIVDISKQAEQRYGDKIAVQEGSFCLNFKQLLTLARKAAKALISSGLQSGDRAAIWAPNIHEWIIAALGIQYAGGVLVPINTRWKGEEAAYVLQRSGARWLFTLNQFQLGPTQSIDYLSLLDGQAVPDLQECILLRGQETGICGWHELLVRGEAVPEAELEERMAAIQADSTMDMLFTSGTTGRPKGVLCSQAQNIRTVTTWAQTVGLNADDRYLIINPFFHSFGYKAGWLAALIQGAQIFPALTFDVDTILEQIEREQITMLPGPPTIYQSLLAHPERTKHDLSSLRLAVTGAASVPVKLVEDMRSVLGFSTVVTAYGLTECCGFVSICRPDDPAELIANTSGRAMEGVEVKCVDASGAEVATGEPGEIWVRGYNVMQGYFEDPDATAAALTADGWLKTGDIGHMNADGYISITDRLKDMYICGGFNVYPAEVENKLSALDGIVQVAVIGVADERLGEVGKAYVVKEPTATLTESAIIDYCKASMSNYKVPRSVEFIAQMPLNASGKILKTQLRTWSKQQQ